MSTNCPPPMRGKGDWTSAQRRQRATEAGYAMAGEPDEEGWPSGMTFGQAMGILWPEPPKQPWYAVAWRKVVRSFQLFMLIAWGLFLVGGVVWLLKITWLAVFK